jgi:hypothetical protein
VMEWSWSLSGSLRSFRRQATMWNGMRIYEEPSYSLHKQHQTFSLESILLYSQCAIKPKARTDTSWISIFNSNLKLILNLLPLINIKNTYIYLCTECIHNRKYESKFRLTFKCGSKLESLTTIETQC